MSGQSPSKCQGHTALSQALVGMERVLGLIENPA